MSRFPVRPRPRPVPRPTAGPTPGPTPPGPTPPGPTPPGPTPGPTPAPTPAPLPSTFTLTTNPDTIVGVVSNATIFGTGVATGGNNGGTGTTLNVFDTISLTGTNNTLNLNTAGATISFAATNSPVLNGVQNVTFTNQGGNIAWAGSLSPNLIRASIGTTGSNGTFTVTSAPATLNTLSLSGVTGAGNNQSITFVPGALTAATDSFTVNIAGSRGSTDNGINALDIALVGGAAAQGVEQVTINASGAPSSIGTLSSTDGTTALLTSLTVNNTSSGLLNIFNSLDFAGAGGTVNATASTAGVAVTFATETNTFLGGSGDDVVAFANAGDLNNSDIVNFGGGSNNTLFVADTSVSSTTTALNSAINGTGAQIVGFSATASADLSLLNATRILTNNPSADITLSNFASTDKLIVTGTVAGATRDLVVPASLGFNSVNIDFVADGADSTTDVLNATSQATINIASLSTSTAFTNTVATLTNSTNSIINISGAGNFTVTNNLNAAANVNASALTGKLDIDGANAASIITGGSNDDTIESNTAAGGDTIVGGNGSDTIALVARTGTTRDSITGGLKADTINFGANTAAGVANYNVTAAESFAVTGQSDTIAIANTAAGNSEAITLVTGVLSSTITAATSVNIGTTVVQAGSFLWINTGGVITATNADSVLYQDSNLNGIIDSTDLQVNFDLNGADTFTAAVSGGQAVITLTGV